MWKLVWRTDDKTLQELTGSKESVTVARQAIAFEVGNYGVAVFRQESDGSFVQVTGQSLYWVAKNAKEGLTKHEDADII